MEYDLEAKREKDFSRLGWALIIANIVGRISFSIYKNIMIYINYRGSIDVAIDVNNLTGSQISIGAMLLMSVTYFVLHIYNRRDGISIIKLIDSKKISIINILKLFMISYSLLLIGYCFTLFVDEILGILGMTISISANVLNNRIGFIYVGFIGPLFEELIFRGVVLNRLKNYGVKFSIITSAIIFAVFHGNFLQLLPAFIMGIFFGYLFVKTNSLFLPIILHMMSNAISITSEFLLLEHPNAGVGGLGLLNITLMQIVFLILTLYILYSSKGKISLGEDIVLVDRKINIKKLGDIIEEDIINSNMEGSQGIYASFFSTLPMILFLIVYILLIMSSVQVI